MLPLSHTYVSTKVTGRKDSLLIFGSVLPDIATTSKGEVGRDKIHYSPKEFYEFVKAKFPGLLDLAVGVRLHSNVDKGADYYSDDTEIGFAKIEGEKITKDVGKLLEMDDEKINLVLAHNFIETGVDLNLRETCPEVFDLYARSLKEIDLKLVAVCLSEYLGLGKGLVLKELGNFVEFLSPDHFLSVGNAAKGAVLPLIELRFGKRVDLKEAERILTTAKEITKNNFLDYLDHAVEKMKIDFADLVIVVEPLREDDIDRLEPILREYVRDRNTSEIVITEIDDIKRYMRGGEDEERRARKYFVARNDSGKVLGCMAYSRPDKDMLRHFNTTADESAELLNAFVAPSVSRGKGIGRKLFEVICNAAKKEGKEYLLVNSGPRYRTSWGFYDKMCDESGGFIVGKYGKGGDAKTWRKRL